MKEIRPAPGPEFKLSPEDALRLAADEKFLEEELIRINKEIEGLNVCDIRMDGDFDVPIRPRIKHKDKNFQSNPL